MRWSKPLPNVARHRPQLGVRVTAVVLELELPLPDVVRHSSLGDPLLVEDSGKEPHPIVHSLWPSMVQLSKGAQQKKPHESARW